jgi:hypothetical protein
LNPNGGKTAKKLENNFFLNAPYNQILQPSTAWDNQDVTIVVPGIQPFLMLPTSLKVPASADLCSVLLPFVNTLSQPELFAAYMGLARYFFSVNLICFRIEPFQFSA